MKPDHAARIVADEDFQKMLDKIGEQLTGKVMATATSVEDREKALAEYHALQRLRSTLRSIAQDHKEN
jgi:hypothetical protein